MVRENLHILAVLLPVAYVIGFAESSLAQQVPTDPSSTHLFPAGGRRGSTVMVRVGGECLPPGTRWRLWGDGVSAPNLLGAATTGGYEPTPRRKPSEQPVSHPREWKSQVDIAADASLGMKLWRLSCGRGGTGSRPFIVGDLPEFIESESNSLPELAERVELPVTINGQIAGESDIDYFRFDAKQDDLVAVDVVAARLGSALDPVVQVIGPDGLRVDMDERRIGADPITAFRASVSGEYRLLISHVTYRGGPNYVYRITLSTAPLVQFAFPPAGRVGTTGKVDLLALSGSSTLNLIREAVMFPASPTEFWQRHHSAMNSFPLIASHSDEVVETPANDSRETAGVITSPIVVNGQFEHANDEDWFKLDCRKEAPLTIECVAYPRWSPALPIVSIVNPDGAVLALSSAVRMERGIVRLEFQPPADGPYWIRVRDLQHGVRSGPEFIYRLKVEASSPDFAITLKSDSINVVQGGRTEVDVAIDRRGGCSEPIEFMVDNLPEGVRVEGQQILAGQTSAKLIFVADATARSCDVTLSIKGRSQVRGLQLERTAVATHLGHDVDGVGVGPTEIDHVQLTVVHKPVFKLYCNEAYQYAHRGTVYRYQMEIERLDGFDGPIHLEVADRQIKDLDGIQIPNTTIPSGQSTFTLPLYLPETMHINVQAHSNVYAQGHVEFMDSFGQKQTMLVVSTMRCMIRTLPPVAKLRSVKRTIQARSGESVPCVLAIDRTSQFTGTMRVELVDPPAGITATPVEFDSRQTEQKISVHFDSKIHPGSNLAIRFRGTGKMTDTAMVVTEAAIPLEFPETMIPR